MFDSRAPVGRETLEVDFVRRPAAKGRVRSVLVIPVDQQAHLSAHGFSPRGEREAVCNVSLIVAGPARERQYCHAFRWLRNAVGCRAAGTSVCIPGSARN